MINFLEKILPKKKEVKTEVINTVDIKLHTVFILVGPSGCGKSHFAKNYLVPQLKSISTKKRMNVQYISSDDTRREILGDDSFQKMDHEMQYVSHQAFGLLYEKLRCATSYPVNAEFAVVDTTGLSKEFREDIINIAKSNNYNVACIMFDYKDRSDYYTYIKGDNFNQRVTSRHLEKMRKQTMKELSKKDFYLVEKIKTRDFNSYKFNVTDLVNYESNILPFDIRGEEYEYIIIGDIHGCFDEFISLLEKHDFTVNENGILMNEDMRKRIVLVGDLIDKGYGVEKLIRFVDKNLAWFKIVLGNHENFVYKYLKGKINKDGMPPQEVLDSYFDSISLFENDEDLKQRFFDLVYESRPFLMHRDFIVTHAPCDIKHLGKMNNQALKAQRTYMYAKRKDFESDEAHFDAVQKDFEFVKKQAQINWPVHVFGHVQSKSVSRFKNKVNIDTGCVSGNKLSSITINAGRKPFILSVNSDENPNITFEKIPFSFFEERDGRKIDLNSLEPRERGRMFFAGRNKINFISGTVSPSDKNIDTNTLESLGEALDFYKKNGVGKVVLQPKYMGSRCNIYLFEDVEKCYATTRNGHLIDYIEDMDKVFKKLLKRKQFKDMFKKDDVKMILLDTELMPWSALGKGLIEKNFVSVEKAVETENEFLRNSGFETVVNSLIEEYKDSGHEQFFANNSKKDVKKKFGEAKDRTYKNLKSYMKFMVPISESEKSLNIFSRQIELYGQDGDIHAKPFSLLKLVYNDDSEKLVFNENNEDIYKTVSDDNYAVIDLTSERGYEEARKFYENETENEEMEGIMVKPYIMYVAGLPPCLKVRNPRYLTIVYGMDYTAPHKYEKLINKKRIRRKLQTSVKEWEIGKRMLEIPYKDVSDENEDYLQTVAQMITEERYEVEIDPRL